MHTANLFDGIPFWMSWGAHAERGGEYLYFLRLLSTVADAGSDGDQPTNASLLISIPARTEQTCFTFPELKCQVKSCVFSPS